MPGEKKNGLERLSRSSIGAALALNDGQSKEFFWGCQLSGDKQEVTWNVAEDLHGEDDDSDYLMHTLFLRHAVLGAEAKKDDTNIIEVHTRNFQGETVKQPLISLTKGRTDMCYVDINFSQEIPVTFKLISGSGPIFLSGQHLVEFPRDDDEDEEELTEDESIEEENEEEIATAAPGLKRKATQQKNIKAKKGKLESFDKDSASDEEGEESIEEDDEDEEEEDESDLSESSPEKPPKKNTKMNRKPTKQNDKKTKQQVMKAKKPVSAKRSNKSK